jgi:hypothetical protein
MVEKGAPGIKLFLFIGIMSAVCASCLGRERPAVVFAVNAFPKAVSLRIGEEPGPVWHAASLPANGISAVTGVRAVGVFPVFYKLAGRDKWQRLPSELGRAQCRILPGSVSAVVVDPRGFIRVQTFGDDPRPGAKVSFLNATARTVASFDLFVPPAEAFPVFRARHIRSGAATRFRSVVPGEYSLQAAFASLAGVRNAIVESNVRCEDDAYWLICCFMRKDTPVFKLHMVAKGEGGPLSDRP